LGFQGKIQEEAKFMAKRLWLQGLVTLICTLVFVSIAAAHEVNITEQVKIGDGSQLQAGTYRVEVTKDKDPAEVRFYRDGDLVLQASATISTEAEKYANTEILSEQVDNGRAITEIRLKGSKERLIFKQITPPKSN
jgi:hypothetical protein